MASGMAASPTARTSRSYALQMKLPHSPSSSAGNSNNPPVKTCLCSPSNHPLAFRCSYHKSRNRERTPSPCYTSSNIKLLKTAVKNSLVRMGGKEAELATNTLIIRHRPPSPYQPRKQAFQIRPSRLSIMSN